MLKLDKQIINDVLIIKAGGDLNIMASEKFNNFITENLKEYKKIIIDLEELKMLDSSGIAKLIYLKKMMDKKNKRLYLMNLTKIVHEILSLGKLDTIFKIITKEEFDQITNTNE